LIVKDPQREWKDKVQEANLSKVTKVIGVGKLRDKFKPFESKRQLCSQYNLFVADDRVVEMLPKILGKTFFLKKKYD
jgi:ribosome biogenesis protein UTP30